MLGHNTQLREKLKKNKSFRQEMDETDAKYQLLLQRAIYSNLQQISSKFIVQAGKDEQNHRIFFIFGEQQPTKKKNIEKMYMYLIKFMDDKISNKQQLTQNRENQPFSIVYFNTCCQSYNNYSTFRTIYRTLPLKYFTHLKKMIIIDPSFTVKAMEWFVTGTINKILHNALDYVYDLKQLKNHKIIMTSNKLSLLPNKIASELKNQISRLSIRQSIQLRMIPLKNMKLEEHQMSEVGVPLILQLLISYFLGLFRKSVVKTQIDQAMNFLLQKYYDFLQQITNPHIVANLITRFIRQLEQPLITVSIYDKLIHDNGRSKQISYLKQIFQQLPLVNRVTLLYLFDFLLQKVVPLKEFNKMTIYNLSVVLAPCILRSGKQLAIQQLMYSKKLAFILQFILSNYESIFGNKNQRLQLLRQSIKTEKMRFINSQILGQKQGQQQNQSSSQQQGQDYLPDIQPYVFKAQYDIPQQKQNIDQGIGN